MMVRGIVRGGRVISHYLYELKHLHKDDLFVSEISLHEHDRNSQQNQYQYSLANQHPIIYHALFGAVLGQDKPHSNDGHGEEDHNDQIAIAPVPSKTTAKVVATIVGVFVVEEFQLLLALDALEVGEVQLVLHVLQFLFYVTK